MMKHTVELPDSTKIECTSLTREDLVELVRANIPASNPEDYTFVDLYGNPITQGYIPDKIIVLPKFSWG